MLKDGWWHWPSRDRRSGPIEAELNNKQSCNIEFHNQFNDQSLGDIETTEIYFCNRKAMMSEVVINPDMLPQAGTPHSQGPFARLTPLNLP